jgi:hypothetical protein
MSTSAISSPSIPYKLEAYIKARHQDLNKLGRALQWGDLSAAQQDNADIQNLGKRGPLANGDPFLNSNRERDFEAIGSALQSGDLDAARQGFEQLVKTFGRVVPAPLPQPSPVGSKDPAKEVSDPARDLPNGSFNVKA